MIVENLSQVVWELKSGSRYLGKVHVIETSNHIFEMFVVISLVPIILILTICRKTFDSDIIAEVVLIITTIIWGIFVVLLKFIDTLNSFKSRVRNVSLLVKA